MADSSSDKLVQPLGGTFTGASPSCLISFGGFVTVGDSDAVGPSTRSLSPFPERLHLGLGTGRSAFSGCLRADGVEEVVVEVVMEEVGGGVKGEGRRGGGS